LCHLPSSAKKLRQAIHDYKQEISNSDTYALIFGDAQTLLAKLGFHCLEMLAKAVFSNHNIHPSLKDFAIPTMHHDCVYTIKRSASFLLQLGEETGGGDSDVFIRWFNPNTTFEIPSLLASDPRLAQFRAERPTTAVLPTKEIARLVTALYQFIISDNNPQLNDLHAKLEKDSQASHSLSSADLFHYLVIARGSLLLKEYQSRFENNQGIFVSPTCVLPQLKTALDLLSPDCRIVNNRKRKKVDDVFLFVRILDRLFGESYIEGWTFGAPGGVSSLPTNFKGFEKDDLMEGNPPRARFETAVSLQRVGDLLEILKMFKQWIVSRSIVSLI
jgi:hypothetical protein